jgi:hypothetical protein
MELTRVTGPAFALYVVTTLAACLSANGDDGVTPVPFVLSDEFTASGDYGDGQTANDIVMSVNDPGCLSRPLAAGQQAGPGFCYTFTYVPLPVGDGQPGQGFGGVSWQSPPNNWGDYPGKRIAQGAKAVHFIASTDTPGVVVTFGVGQPASSMYPYSDTFVPTLAEQFTLTGQMQAFTLTFGAFQKYDRVLAAFNWTISDQYNNYMRLGVPPGQGITLYINDIVWDVQ